MKPNPRDGILRGANAATIRLLILVAAGVSAYLLSVSLSGGSAVGCGPGSSCDEVLQSRWAYFFRMPVSALALGVDLALLLATFGCGPRSTPRQRRGAWELIVPCAMLLFGAALWFTALQAVVLHRFCPWCLTAHTCGAVAAVLLLLRVPVTNARERREKDPSVSRSIVVRLAGAAVAAVALLGAVQSVTTRQTYSEATMNLPVTNIASVPIPFAPAVKTNVVTAPVVAPSAAPASKFLDVFGGRIRLDLAQVPVWGSVDAPHKLLSLYDYTCHHCRDMHSRVVEVQRSFGGRLAVVSLPMPLDGQCNPLVTRTPAPHVNACQYARLGLAVGRAKPGAIEKYDDWFFGFDRPPSLTDATNQAVALVGAAAFEKAASDPWIEQQIQTAIALYKISGLEYRQGSMPQFIIGTNIISGTLSTAELRAKIAPVVEPAP